MPKIAYAAKRFFSSSLRMIEHANTIITEYQAQGFELTLRQLYYQFVSRDLLENSQKEYKRLGSVINDARLAGLIDWDAIVDRTRNLKGLSHWNNPREIVDSALHSYRIDKWENQPRRVEVWIEKDALAGVIERVCTRNDVPYFSCRGYTSQSEMWVASQRLEQYRNNGQSPAIIHLGDHDPSGIDMTRDIDDRQMIFMDGCEVNRIALNMKQVQKYNPPPNPAKLTDSRVGGYIKKFGKKSWELDALEPKVLDALVEKTILAYRDDDLWAQAEAREEEDRAKLTKLVKALK